MYGDYFSIYLSALILYFFNFLTIFKIFPLFIISFFEEKILILTILRAYLKKILYKFYYELHAASFSISFC